MLNKKSQKYFSQKNYLRVFFNLLTPVKHLANLLQLALQKQGCAKTAQFMQCSSLTILLKLKYTFHYLLHDEFYFITILICFFTIKWWIIYLTAQDYDYWCILTLSSVMQYLTWQHLVLIYSW